MPSSFVSGTCATVFCGRAISPESAHNFDSLLALPSESSKEGVINTTNTIICYNPTSASNVKYPLIKLSDYEYKYKVGTSEERIDPKYLTKKLGTIYIYSGTN